jgi:hypothetical protein
MSTRPDIDRPISGWLSDQVPERASERLLEATRSEIRTTQQRRAWWPAWRAPDMNSYTKFAIAAVALLIVAIVTINLLPGRDLGAVGASPSATPAASGAVPSPNPAASDGAASRVPGEFTACVPTNSELRHGTDETKEVPYPDGDMTLQRRRGFTWAGAITATDERFSGTHYYSWDGDTYTLPSGAPGPEIVAESHRIENDQGAWMGWSMGGGLKKDTKSFSPVFLKGEGAYDGQTAILFPGNEAGGCFFSFTGVVLDFPEPRSPFTGE